MTDTEHTASGSNKEEHWYLDSQYKVTFQQNFLKEHKQLLWLLFKSAKFVLIEKQGLNFAKIGYYMTALKLVT